MTKHNSSDSPGGGTTEEIRQEAERVCNSKGNQILYSPETIKIMKICYITAATKYSKLMNETRKENSKLWEAFERSYRGNSAAYFKLAGFPETSIQQAVEESWRVFKTENNLNNPKSR